MKEQKQNIKGWKNKYNFLVKYYYLTKDYGYWSHKGYSMCDANMFCFSTCPVNKKECTSVFAGKQPDIPEVIFNEFKINHPEYFV